MNQTTFEELVKDPSLLNKDTLPEIEQLLKEYPFCQTIHLLYTKNLYQLKHIRYHQQLKLAAAIVGDRSRLKHYIEDGDNLKCEPVVPQVPEIILGSDVVVEIQQQEEIIAKTSGITEKDTADEYLTLSTLVVEMSREEKKKAIIAMINKKFSERNDLLEDKKPEILTENIEVVSIREVKTETEEEIIDASMDEKEVSIESVSDMAIESTTPTDTFSEEISENIVLENFENAYQSEDLISEIEQPIPVEKTKVISSEMLIDRFLRDAPRISRPKKAFYNPVNLAARSIEENEDFYTETYATICLKQGDANKAIKIYEKLSLKLPEKSSYFAGLIEKIKKEQNI